MFSDQRHIKATYSLVLPWEPQLASRAVAVQRGAEVSHWESLKQKGNILQHVLHGQAPARKLSR